MEYALQAHAAGKRYGRRWALRDCTVELPAGHVAALVGPNGAGKSTFLHLAVGLSRPDAGTIRVLGADPYDNTTVLADLGFVAQDTPVYRDFTADDLLTMGGKLNRRWDAGLARRRLAQLGIPPHRPVGKLSGGQRAQVALALALAKRPRLLVLDEPVASLDPLARQEFLQSLMGSVAEAETSVLLSSHILADLERSCDYLIVLQGGRTQLAGEIDDIVAGHRRLIGPRHLGEPIGGVTDIVRAAHTDRQSTLMVRAEGAIRDPLWTVQEPTLEDIILAHLAQTDARATHQEWGVAA
ncbi:ABC transporter ATP-binding protein [Actinoplanes sp. N902-109]|uniref:ABC transporter ATP-binding protein n=1 Tax=Actinoplanes sp. (strain N902-109) TaxID=649831 RepID=UPI0003296102|nr:ABC transporter ATP-binding protein [Actinoplanes sp. N902-109]AGL17648.1 ABC transport system ATP-binding protein [Actinoplanes sp. N902-109]